MAILNKSKPGKALRGRTSGTPAMFDADGRLIDLKVGTSDEGKIITFDNDGDVVLVDPSSLIVKNILSEITVNTATWTVSHITAYKISNMIFLYFDIRNKTGETVTGANIGTIPSQYIPSVSVVGWATIGRVIIGNNGDMTADGSVPDGTYFRALVYYDI